MKFLFIVTAFIALSLVSCKKDDDPQPVLVENLPCNNWTWLLFDLDSSRIENGSVTADNHREYQYFKSAFDTVVNYEIHIRFLSNSSCPKRSVTLISGSSYYPSKDCGPTDTAMVISGQLHLKPSVSANFQISGIKTVGEFRASYIIY